MNRANKFALLSVILAGVTLAPGCKPNEEAKPAEAAPDEKAPDPHRGEVKLTAEAIKRYDVQAAEVRKLVLTPTFLAPARVTLNSDAMAHVGSVMSGRVVDIKVKKGDAVKKGEELLVVESPELGEAQSDYVQKRAAVEIARPAVELAKSAYDRGKKLLEESQGITVTDLQKREGEYRAAQGALRSAESVATAAENKLHLLGMDQSAVEALAKSGEIKPRYSIAAPIGGQVLEREVTLGELVSPDKESLLVIADLSTLWVIADVPELRLRETAKDARADVMLVAARSEKLQGKVSFIDPAMDPGTRTARVRIEVQNGNGFIRPGMFAQVEIFTPLTTDSAQPVLVIPEEAVQTIEGVTVVFMPVSGEENTFVKKIVTLGKSVGGMLPVEAGLKEGDKIVVRSSFILKAELGKGSVGDD